MTKAQVRAKLKPLLERLGDLRAELYDLRDSVKETAESIEPYKGRQSLRQVQEDRQSWMSDVADVLDDLLWEMNSAEANLEDR